MQKNINVYSRLENLEKKLKGDPIYVIVEDERMKKPKYFSANGRRNIRRMVLLSAGSAAVMTRPAKTLILY